MKTNFQTMMELKDWYPAERSFISGEEMDFVSEKFNLAERSIIELRNLRDFVVLWNNRKGVDYEDIHQEMKEIDKMSALCGVIDSEIWNRGGEV